MGRHVVRSGLALPLLLLALLLLLLGAAVRAFQLRPVVGGGAARAGVGARACTSRSRRGLPSFTRLHSIRTGGSGGKGKDDEESGYGPERIQDPDAALSPEEWQKKYGEEVDTTVLYDEKVRTLSWSWEWAFGFSVHPSSSSQLRLADHPHPVPRCT